MATSKTTYRENRRAEVASPRATPDSREYLDGKNGIVIRHVRGMFGSARLRAARDYLVRRYQAVGMQTESDRECKAAARGEGSDQIRLDPYWYGIWCDPSSVLLEAVGAYRWIVFPPQVRWMRYARQRVPWHQDLAYQHLLGPRGHARLITCFIPLEEWPVKHATVEFAHCEPRALEHQATEGFDAGLPGLYPEKPWYYGLALGDAVLFSELALHRTSIPPGVSPERRSLEFRLVEPSLAIEGKDYFDLEQGKFVRLELGYPRYFSNPLFEQAPTPKPEYPGDNFG